MKSKIIGKKVFIFLNEKDEKILLSRSVRNRITIFYSNTCKIKISCLNKEKDTKYITSDTLRDPVVDRGFHPSDIRIKIPREDLESFRRDYILLEILDIPRKSGLHSIIIFFPDYQNDLAYASEEKILQQFGDMVTAA